MRPERCMAISSQRRSKNSKIVMIVLFILGWMRILPLRCNQRNVEEPNKHQQKTYLIVSLVTKMISLGLWLFALLCGQVISPPIASVTVNPCLTNSVNNNKMKQILPDQSSYFVGSGAEDTLSGVRERNASAQRVAY